MDKFYLAKTIAGDRKKEIDHDLRIRHMLQEANSRLFKVSKTRRLVMRYAPAVIIISILAMLVLKSDVGA